MSWSSTTLGGVFAKQLQEAQDKIALLTSQLASLSAMETDAANAKTAAQDAVDDAQSLIDSLAASGIFVLSMESEQGVWSQRLLDAVGYPSRDTAYCAILANIVQGVSGSSIASSYNSMKASLLSALKDPNPINEFSAKPSLVQEITPSYPEENEWQSITLGEMMPGTFAGAKNKLNGAKKVFSKADQALMSVQSKITAVESSLTEATNTFNNLSNTGVYTVQISPQSGDWYDLLTSQSNSPDVSSSLYSAGMITVIRTAEYADALDAWNKLLDAL